MTHSTNTAPGSAGQNGAHTPGPWVAWQAPTGEWTVRSVYTDEQGRRCTAWPAVCNAGAQDNEANARLIAAAPQMLAALREADRRLHDDGYTVMDPVTVAVRTAIAAATGEDGLC